ncbi:hypothetical protein XELAEV_18005475mg [Xenopus laevis]|uniref:Uncharacterized protein n=1 Tax=Xenopus laevis TaxID=8355 RepID=A0A974I2M5_XENLA|nr:hypothetical protein XELAEV_18005475mg [Xenopus laevis]
MLSSSHIQKNTIRQHSQFAKRSISLNTLFCKLCECCPILIFVLSAFDRNSASSFLLSLSLNFLSFSF